MRRSGAILFHAGAFAALVVFSSMLFFATADDGTWHPRPHEGDVGDDDGSVVATLNVMLYVVPVELVTYLAALLVSRWSRGTTPNTPS